MLQFLSDAKMERDSVWKILKHLATLQSIQNGEGKAKTEKKDPSLFNFIAQLIICQSTVEAVTSEFVFPLTPVSQFPSFESVQIDSVN
jgi:hypothetical protein